MYLHYTIKGVDLDMADILEVINYYNDMMLFSEIKSKYGINNKDQAVKFGKAIERLVSNGFTEEEAVEMLK